VIEDLRSDEQSIGAICLLPPPLLGCMTRNARVFANNCPRRRPEAFDNSAMTSCRMYAGHVRQSTERTNIAAHLRKPAGNTGEITIVIATSMLRICHSTLAAQCQARALPYSPDPCCCL
jgi:hypothetical protein